MNRTATVFTAQYRARGYSPEDEQHLRQELEQFGAVRLRPMHLPDAGGVTELTLIVAFIGAAYASGIIEHIAGKHYEALAAALRRFVSRKAERDGETPELALRVSYDDVEFEIGPVEERDLLRLPNLASQI